MMPPRPAPRRATLRPPVDRIGLVCAAVIAAEWIAPGDAFAYLDPGTGSIVLQAVVGSVLGAAYLARRNWQKLVTFVRRDAPPPDAVAREETSPAPGSGEDPDA